MNDLLKAIFGLFLSLIIIALLVLMAQQFILCLISAYHLNLIAELIHIYLAMWLAIFASTMMDLVVNNFDIKEAE
jgi:hypothetical protein